MRPRTLSLRPDTMALVVRDIAESLLRHGIHKLLIVSAHDGNPPAATVAARVLSQEHDMSVASFSGRISSAMIAAGSVRPALQATSWLEATRTRARNQFRRRQNLSTKVRAPDDGGLRGWPSSIA